MTDPLDALLPPDPGVGRVEPPAFIPTGQIPADLPKHLRDRLAEAPNGDRSAQTAGLVAAAVEWGLDDSQVLALALEHRPTVDKYGNRADREAKRVLDKVRPDHTHVGQPCDRAGCPNTPQWMTGDRDARRGQVAQDRQTAEAPAAAELLPTQPAGRQPTGERPLPLIDGLLQEGELLVLGAARGIGKSWWGMDLGYQLARGHGRVMGTYTVRQGARVLYCHGELDPWAAYDRWARLRGDQDMPAELLETFEPWRIKVVRRRVTHSGDGLSTSEEDLDVLLDGRLEQTIIAKRIEVLIIDPWAVFYSGRENSNDEAELALAELRRLQLTYGLTVVVLHHFGKADTARDPEDLWRGASRLADWASTRVTLLPFYTPQQATKIGMTRQQARQYATVKLLRRNAATPYDIAVKWNPETGQWDRWHAPDGEGDLIAGPTPADVAAKCPVPDGWASTVEAAAALEIGRTKTRDLLEQARQQGLLEAVTGTRGAQGWRVKGTAK